MHCPFCNRKPNEIDEYIEGAEENEMSAENYVQMDEGTYHQKTNLFCCTECYVSQGLPSITVLHEAFMRYRVKVIELRG